MPAIMGTACRPCAMPALTAVNRPAERRKPPPRGPAGQTLCQPVRARAA